MRIPLQERGQSPMRSLDTLQRDYLRFCSEGKGSLKNAKHFNNVIGQPFFDIPLVQVHLKCMSTMYANVYMHICTCIYIYIYIYTCTYVYVRVIMLQLEPTLMHTHEHKHMWHMHTYAPRLLYLVSTYPWGYS